jgi:hypothetical protein
MTQRIAITPRVRRFRHHPKNENAAPDLADVA